MAPNFNSFDAARYYLTNILEKPHLAKEWTLSAVMRNMAYQQFNQINASESTRDKYKEAKWKQSVANTELDLSLLEL